ncbi:MAG: glycosyltransferase family 4 protein [Candidatus Thermoplasmatota archaeon]|nr:glycosyltransferase family 4 protein [Candidatus Thermoplasmatota archaeon]
MADILQLCIRYPPAPGGAETHVSSLTSSLVELGHSVSVYTSDLYKEFPFTRLEEEEKKKIPVKRHRAYSLKGDLHYVFFPSLLRSLLSEDFDLYHAHSYGYFHMNVASFYKNLKDKPLVITPHFHPEWSMWGGKKRKKIRKLYDSCIAQSVMDSAERIIGVTRNEIDLLSERLDIPEEKVEIIPNGIDPEDFDPMPEGSTFKQRYDVESPMVLYTGRLASNKGLMDLVEAMPAVLKEDPDTTFVLVGEDEGMKEQIKKRAHELDVEDSLIITGYIEDYDVFKAAYAAADVYVLPSEYEAFGIVLLEAMMCETPCIGTDVGGVPEVIDEDETGFIVEYGDPKKLSSNILTLLRNPRMRKEMGEKGRKKVLENFTWKKVAEEVERVYEELI